MLYTEKIDFCTIKVDLHGMPVIQAKREMQQLLKTCPKHITEIEVVHGYINGQALQKYIRKELSHPKIERKVFGMNNGSTTLIIKNANLMKVQK